MDVCVRLPRSKADRTAAEPNLRIQNCLSRMQLLSTKFEAIETFIGAYKTGTIHEESKEHRRDDVERLLIWSLTETNGHELALGGDLKIYRRLGGTTPITGVATWLSR